MMKLKDTQFEVYPIGKEKYLLKGEVSKSYLMLPVEDQREVSKLTLLVDNNVCKQLNVRLATKRVEYLVPLDISAYKGEQISIIIEGGAPEGGICWNHFKECDQFDRTNWERFKPQFHFSPDYGWMNDPNGMFFKDGVYHLCFQYNPYGSTWENMSWGHATSLDLVTWKHEPDVLHRDGFGDMFSGGAIVDTRNDAGFGKDAIIAFYTNAGVGQLQCIAYSVDEGQTFTKYKNNPILTSEVADFRDPKVFWHEESQRWIMLLSVDQHMEIYSSKNVLDWSYESSFGENEGAHGGVWECPDLVELPIEGSTEKRWVLLCNINPGGPFGGSATQYFVGTFDGKRFVNDSPLQTKWMDFGKDFYATVTWANVPNNRAIALGWMSNWQYANEVPTKQFRSANAIPRDLLLFRQGEELYLQSMPVPELKPFVKEELTLKKILVNREFELSDLFDKPTPAYSISVDITNVDADVIGIKLLNSLNEEVTISLDVRERVCRMSRDKSGLVAFDPTETFANDTVAPLFGDAKEITLEILVDASSIEVFGNGGKFTLTNLVFPQEPYKRLRLFGKGGSFKVDVLRINQITAKPQMYQKREVNLK